MKTAFDKTAFDDLLSKTGKLWSEAAASPDIRLLRIALIRRFALEIHARRSGFIASGDATHTDLLVRLELHLERLLEEGFSGLPLETVTFEELIRKGSDPPAPRRETLQRKPDRPPSLPEEFTKWLDPIRLDRRDRRWEKALAIEAHHQGWSYWQWVVDVEIHQVESWANALSARLWPRGILLYVESDGFIEVDDANASLAYWRGRWLMILEPGVEDPGALSVGPLPGSRPGLPGEWRMLLRSHPRQGSGT